jgi:hypothetical protein
MDINALHAHQVKSEISLIQTKPDVLHNQSVTLTQSNLLMMLTHAEDANNAHSDNDQTNWELLVSQFHLLFANALRDNLLIDTHAKHAQLDKLWAQPTHNYVSPQLVEDNQIPLDQFLITSNAVIALLAKDHNKFQTLRELHALTDLLPTAHHAHQEDLTMDTHALLAQLDSSKIQTICNNASNHFAMDNTKFNNQSTLKLVEDVLTANGQDKFQTIKKLLVSTDHSQTAQTASREDLPITTPVSNAFQVKLKTQLTKTDVSALTVMEETKSNFHMTQDHAEDARLAHSQDKSQTYQEQFASTDHLPHVVADKSNHQMVTAALTAQQVQSRVSPTKRYVLDQIALNNTKSLLPLMSTAAEDVILATSHNSSQTELELNVLPDHLLTATVSAEDQVLDINARDAQPVKFNTQMTQLFACNQPVMDNTKSPDQLTQLHVVNAKTANGQDTCQTTRELNAFWDHSLNVTASADNLKMVTLVNSVTMVKDKIQPTKRDVLQLHSVTQETKLSVLEMLPTATNAEHALFHRSQAKIDKLATDQDQNADVLRNTH